MQSFEVPGRFPSCNEFYRMQLHQQNRVKQECDNAVSEAAKLARIKRVNRARFRFKWYEPNRRRDLDNVAFGKKFVFDGLVKAGVLIDDGPNHVMGFSDEFAYDRDNPRIRVEIYTEGERQWR